MTRARLCAWAAAGTTLLALAGTAAAGPPAAAHDDDLGPAIEAIMHKPGYEHAQWGVLESDPVGGRVIHSQFADQYFIPGSTTKLATISTALTTLGWNHRFTTPVRATGHRTGPTLHGDLALVAQGDLTMGGRTRPDGTVDYTDIDHTEAALPGATLTPENPLAGINRIAAQIRASGIRRVDGNVIIDPRLFTPPALSPQPVPMILNDNLIDLLSTPTTPGRPAKLFWRPQVAPYQVTSGVRTVASGGTTAITVTTSPDGTKIHLSGTIAAGAQPLLKVSPIQDPNAFARTALIEALARAGVTVTAPPTGPNPQNRLPASYGGDPRVAAYVSPPYSQYAKLILKVSHNLGANLALCNMAVEIGSRNCFDAFPVERDFLARVADIDPGQFQLSDGRGGTAADRITPRALVEILDYWLRTPRATDFRLLLPILGVNGSNAISCTTDCPAKGKVFAKPGTIIGDDLLNQQLEVAAQNEAGYLKTDDGRLLTFFVGVNGASSPSLDAFLSIFNDVNQITALLQEQASAPWRR